MSENSSSNGAATLRKLGIIEGAFLSLLAFKVPQLFVGQLAPHVAPLLPQSQNAAIFLLYLLVEVLTVGILMIALKAYKLSLSNIGLGRFKVTFIPFAILGFVVYFGLSLAISAVAQLFFNFNPNQEQPIGFAESSSTTELALIFMLLVVIVPFTEEFLFRGFLFRALRAKLSFVWTTLLVSAAFGLVHGQVNVGLDVFALSLVLCYLRERTESLWPALVLHSLKNGVAFFILFIYNGH